MSTPELLPRLFDPSVATWETELLGEAPSELFPEELAQIQAARPERILEFQAGRHCARRAMERLGVAPATILRHADRSPIWPEGIVGSITHTRAAGRGFCGAAVARASEIRAIGVDVEPDSDLEERVFRRVLTASERSFIDAEPPGERGLLAKIVFSAKESTYKCQYGITGQFLEFHDVEVTIAAMGGSDTSFSAVLLREAGSLRPGQVFRGKVKRDRGLVLTGVSLPAR